TGVQTCALPISGFLDHHQIALRGAPGMRKGRLVLRTVVAFHRRLERGEARNHVARPVVALELHVAPATGEEDPTVLGDRRARERGVAAIGLGIRDLHMGDPERPLRRAHAAPPITASAALTASSAFDASAPPACAMSGRPPPPLPPSASAAALTIATAESRSVRSAVTPA